MIKISNLSMKMGSFVIEKISLEVPTGKYGLLMGKSGSGKTTILEAICGLRPVRGGTIELLGRDVTSLAPGERDIGYVPQDAALFSKMSVRDNIAFALTIRNRAGSEIESRVQELSELLEVGHLLDRMPAGLSGGEAQRVALGRALAHTPNVLLLDEPINALDEEIHEDMCELLKSLQHYTGVTVLHVTHNSRETKRLADHVFQIRDGQVDLGNEHCPEKHHTRFQ